MQRRLLCEPKGGSDQRIRKTHEKKKKKCRHSAVLREFLSNHSQNAKVANGTEEAAFNSDSTVRTRTTRPDEHDDDYDDDVLLSTNGYGKDNVMLS